MPQFDAFVIMFSLGRAVRHLLMRTVLLAAVLLAACTPVPPHTAASLASTPVSVASRISIVRTLRVPQSNSSRAIIRVKVYGEDKVARWLEGNWKQISVRFTKPTSARKTG